MYVENVTAQRVDNEEAVLALLAMGSNARTKGETQVSEKKCPARTNRAQTPLDVAIRWRPDWIRSARDSF